MRGLAGTLTTSVGSEGYVEGRRIRALALGVLGVVLALLMSFSNSFVHPADAATTRGTVRAWGYNSNGQLGDGTNNDSKVPVKVQNLSGVKAIAAGEYHSLAVK